MEQKKGLKLGLVSFFGTFLIAYAIASKSGALNVVANDIVLLLSGKVHEIPQDHTTLLLMLSVIFATIVIELPCTIVANILQQIILGKRKGNHPIYEMFAKMGEGNHFFLFFVIVVTEEITARWFFLGLLTKIPFLSGTVAFYTLFFVGNGLWALMHLSNFKDAEDKKMLRVLPQFVAGIFFTYIFVKYGLLAVVLAHFASNAVIFAVHKIQRVNVVDGLIVGYAAICAGVSYLLMQKPLTDVMQWFDYNPVFGLQGWDFWDYLKLSVFITSCLAIIFGCLLYDRGGAGEKDDNPIFTFVFGIPLAIMLLYGLYWGLGFLITSVPYRLLLAAIVYTFISRGASGSAVARSFWTGIPEIYITMCIILALGFWFGLILVFLETLIHTPRYVLTAVDD